MSHDDFPRPGQAEHEHPTLGIDPAIADWLIEVAEANPGRLARLLDWITTQEPNSVALDELPAPLVGLDDEAWEHAAELGLGAGELGPAVVARPGCTVADIVRASGSLVGSDELAELLAQVPDLLRVGTAAEPALRTVAAVDVSVLASFAERFGPDALSTAHGQHARPWAHGPLAPASAYQLANAAHHAAASQQPPAAFALAGDADLLARWLRAIGPAATEEAVRAAHLDDPGLTATLVELVRLVGRPAQAEPELAAGLLLGTWGQLRRAQEELGDPRWPVVLGLARIVAIRSAQPQWSVSAATPFAALADDAIFVAEPGLIRQLDPGTAVVVGKFRGPRDPRMLAVGPSLVAVSDATTALVVGRRDTIAAESDATTALVVGQRDTIAPHVRSPISALAVAGTTLVTGHRDGTIALYRLDAPAGTAPNREPNIEDVLSHMLAIGDYAAAESIAKTIADPSAQAEAFRMIEKARASSVLVTDSTGALGVFEAFLRSLDGSDAPPELVKEVEASVAELRSRVAVGAPQDRAAAVLTGHSCPITALHADYGHLVSASTDGMVRVWDLPGRPGIKYSRHGAAVRHIGSWGGYVITADDAGWVRVWDPERGEDRTPLGGHSAGVTGLQVLGSGAVTTASDGSVRWWDLESGTGHRTLRERGPAIVAAALVNVDGGARANAARAPGYSVVGGRPAVWLVTSEADGTLAWWDVEAGTNRTQRATGVLGPVSDLIGGQSAVVVHAGGLSGFALPPAPDVATAQPTVRVDSSGTTARATWGSDVVDVNLVTGTTVAGGPEGLAGAGPAGGVDPASIPAELRAAVQVTAVAATDGQDPGATGLIAVGCADGSVWVQHPSGGTRLIGRHGGPVRALAFIEPRRMPRAAAKSAGRANTPPLRQLVASSAEDAMLRAWDVQRGRCLGAILCDSPLVALDSANGALVGATNAGYLWVVRATPPPTIDLAGEAPPAVLVSNVELSGRPGPPMSSGSSREFLLDATFTLVTDTDVDLLAVELQLLPAALFPTRWQRVTASSADPGPTRSAEPNMSAEPPVTLHEPLPLRAGTATVAFSAAFTALGEGPPSGLELGVTLFSPGLGGPVEFTVPAIGRLGSPLLDGARLAPRTTAGPG